MAWFYRFKPEDVNALTMYQLQGYIRQIGKISMMVNGNPDNPQQGTPRASASQMTDDEMKAELDKYQEAARLSE